jgi:hypothetical protein
MFLKAGFIPWIVFVGLVLESGQMGEGNIRQLFLIMLINIIPHPPTASKTRILSKSTLKRRYLCDTS